MTASGKKKNNFIPKLRVIIFFSAAKFMPQTVNNSRSEKTLLNGKDHV